MLAQYTRLLRQPDEISHNALLLGMSAYKPDAEKATHYTGPIPCDWTMIGEDAMAISLQCANILGLRESGPTNG